MAGAAPPPPWVHLPSEFFLCDLFFKKSLCYFFIMAVAAAAGFVLGGWGWEGHFFALLQLNI